MSQSTLSESIEPSEIRSSSALPSEFVYRPVPVLAPITLFFGVCSFLSLFSLFGVAISIVGTALGALCLWQIRRSEGELSGKWLASVGLALCIAFLFSGSTVHAYTFATEVPEGFRRVNFYRDISKKGIVFNGKVNEIHPDVQALSNEKIFIKGYMYPTRQTEDLTSFLLVKDNQKCCFGGQPALTDMILVELKNGRTFDYTTRLVSVAGVFRTQMATDAEAPANLTPVYALDGLSCERARTAF